MRTLRIVCWPALPVVALLVSLNGATAREGGDPRELCASDAIRLCNAFIPDVPKITACMLAKRSQLSAPCRAAMHPGWGHKGHRGHHRGGRHCGKHGRHCG
jgi:hypothetical protein